MRLSVLGPPALVREDGSSAGLAPGKTLAVLVYLAHAASPPSRADLARLFWPNSDPSKARHSVRQTLSLIRKVLGEDAFASDDPVELRTGAVHTDTADFLEALGSGEIEVADRLWRGTFADGLVLADAPAWTHWVEERQLALEHRLCEGLTTEAEAARFRTDAGAESTTADAIALLRRAISIDPYRERPRTVLVDLLVKQGRLDEAANEIAEARRALGEDTTELRTLERRIEAEVRRRYATGDADPAAALGELFVGRTSEMARLIGAWARAEQGVVVTAVVEGPAGIGKTRLSRELVAHVRNRGGIVAFSSPLPAEANIAGGILRDLETQLITGIAGVKENPGGRAAPRDARDDELSAAERFAELLRRAPAPVLVVVDDLQWADPLTRSVLARVVRQNGGSGASVRSGGGGCLFAFTIRTEAADREVQETARALRDRPGSLGLELGPLSDDEVRELMALATHLEEFETDGALARVLALSAGSPLYVIELLRTLAETGVLITDGSGQLQLTAPLPDPLPFPKGLRELLETRLRALPDEAATIAAHIAGARGRSGVDELRDATGLTAPQFSRGLGTLLDREILGWVGPTELAFAHEEVRRTVARLYPLAADVELTAAQRRRERRFGWAALALATVPIALAVAWRLVASNGIPPTTAPSTPFGGGTIVLLTESEIVEFTPDAGPSGVWAATRSPLPAGAVDEYAGPFLTTEGKRLLFGRILEEGQAPRIVRIEPDGSLVDVARSKWDEGKPHLSPDGRWIAWERGRLQGAAYPHQIRLARADGSDARTIMQRDVKLKVRGWSPSGRYLLVTDAGADRVSLLAITPNGEPRAAWPFDEPVQVAWCGQTDRFVVRGVVDGEPGLWLGSPRATELAPVSAGEVLPYPIACSPDATGVVYSRAVEGRMRLVLLDTRTGRFEPLPPGMQARGGLAWLPDSLAPVIVAIDVAADSVALNWGDTLRLEADVQRSDGRPGENAVAWRSNDPAVVSVRADGTITANGPGIALVTAEVEGWIRDSVRVEVAATDRPDVLLQDDFRELDADRWLAFGAPPARAVQLGDTTALSLPGDGVYHDGVLSRQPFSLRGGATLEFEFRLPLRGTGPQRLVACLVDPGTDLSAWTDVQFIPELREAACFTYPGDELERLRPDEAEVSAAGWRRARPLPGDLPSDDWVRLAIHVRGDGMPFFYVNRRLVGAGPLRLTGLDRTAWQVLLTGKSSETRLLVRRLVVWRGARFTPLTWSLEPIDEASHTYSVWASGETSIWASGGYRLVWHLDGTSWSLQPLPAGTQNTNTLFGLADTLVYIAGQSGVERFDGESWSTLLSDVGELFGIWGTGPDDLFVSGDGRFLHFDGTRWADIPTGLSTEFNTDRLLSVWGSASNDVYVGGYDGRILHWDGSQLTQVLHAPGEHVHRIHGTGPDDVFAVGKNGNIWHFDGSGWSPMESGSTLDLQGVFALSPMEVYAVGARGTLLRFDGASWISESSGTSRMLRDIFGLSPSRMYIAVQGALLVGTR